MLVAHAHTQVKCIPGDGASGDSCLVDGLVCRKNVAHRRMRTSIQQPRILMLRGALENRRASTNLSSFDTMLDQARPPSTSVRSSHQSGSAPASNSLLVMALLPSCCSSQCALLLAQEQSQLRQAVDRIASFEPDILLVEKSAARFTQDALLEKRIALVLNVKGSLLDRLARCTGAQASARVPHSMLPAPKTS